MTWLWIVAAGIAAVFLLVFVVGSLLPRGHVASVTAMYGAPPEVVWNAIRDWRAMPEWRPGLSGVEEWRGAGEQRGWMERSRFGPIPLAIEHEEPPRLLVLRIADEQLPFGGTWTYRVEPEGEGRTRLTLTEDGFIRSPMFRALARFVFGHHRTMAGYARALGKRLGGDVQVVVLAQKPGGASNGTDTKP